MLKKPNFPFFFKKLNKKPTGGKNSSSSSDNSAPASSGAANSGRWGFKNLSSGLRWKRKFNLYLWFVDEFMFKIVSILEATVLVLTFCAFYLCCGCHIWSLFFFFKGSFSSLGKSVKEKKSIYIFSLYVYRIQFFEKQCNKESVIRNFTFHCKLGNSFVRLLFFSGKIYSKKGWKFICEFFSLFPHGEVQCRSLNFGHFHLDRIPWPLMWCGNKEPCDTWQSGGGKARCRSRASSLTISWLSRVRRSQGKWVKRGLKRSHILLF